MTILGVDDKIWIENIIRKVVREELTVEMTWVKEKDEKTGQPLAAPEYKTEKVFLPSFFVQNLKFHEGAYRGFQETIDKHDISIKRLEKGIEASVNILLSMEKPLKQLTSFDTKQIEFAKESKLAKIEAVILKAGSDNEKEKALEAWKNLTGVDYEEKN